MTRNGLFAVPKDGLRDRMVLDGRPANLADRGQTKWCKSMASASSLSGLFIPADEVMVFGGEDLKDYFYQFVVNAERVSRNVLCGDLSIDEAKYVFGADFSWPSPRVAIGLSSLAMGDTCAVEYAQCSHISLMLQKGVAAIPELLSLHGAVPRGLLQVGIIVDDLVLLERVLLAEFESGLGEGCRYESGERLKRARKGYADVGLLNNPKKAFEAEPCASFWGVDMDGRKGLMRASQKRLWPCIVISLRVCALGLCTISLLESLAGMWVSLLQVRRRLFSAMELIFEPLSVKLAGNTIIRLSKELVSEITSIAVLGTLAVVNLRAEFSDFVAATDASSYVMAGVEAPIHPMVTMELSRHCLRKGVWSKLLAPSRALLREHGILPPDEEVPDATFRSHPLWDVVARALPYKESWRRRIRRRQHINISELESYVIEEKRICQRTCCKRVPFGLDSQVSLGAVVKGRAASSKLNGVLRKSLAYPIGADIYALPMYFNTASNRADGPTRDSVPLAPDLPLPAWWDQLCCGEYGAFDAWMKVVGATSPEDEIPFADIAGSSDLDLVPNRVARKRDPGPVVKKRHLVNWMDHLLQASRCVQRRWRYLSLFQRASLFSTPALEVLRTLVALIYSVEDMGLRSKQFLRAARGCLRMSGTIQLLKTC